MRVSAAALLLIAGCSVMPSASEQAMNRMMSGPVSTLTSQLGPPTSRQDVAGETWYTWTQDHIAAGYQQPIHAQCRLSVRVNSGGIMETWRVYGNIAGCYPLLSRVR